ncbi:DNA ligase ATP-dependent [Macrophomina phaseolina MS6]|uniref:DNA ligase ATP-dependent n=1 Tax=Macrophomina phaseolina (strain MS6) TaxID=1126212 RepID=K2S1N2_MACPH|nr:DNA ligase ATP-dependent [Macrophomina phaseolina MS6]
MPFRFTWICDLLQAIEDIECRDPPYLPDRKRALLRNTTEHWFRKHRASLDRPDTDGAAILSTLLPHTRTDRVYSIKAPRMQQLIARCLFYGVSKVKELGRWKEPGAGDLGQCLAQIEKPHDWEPLPGPGLLTVEDVDAALADIAARCRFSSPAVQKTVAADVPTEILQPLLFRMHSREKKWFVRVMLKDFGRAVVDDLLILTEFHFMLPPLLRFQNDFAAAMALLKGPLANYHAKPDHLSQKLLLEQAAQHLKPKVGVKIGRPTWYKARSIKNCLQMVGDGTWVIERKYDGEFCEIHVDLGREDEIQIFSKNGKDATQDRKNLIPAIRDSLKIGTPGCQFRSQCILLGEMVVFNQLQNDVADFDKIRKHVSRSGSFLGTDRDSQPHPYENLMIYYFDILLVDDEVTMALPHNRRRKRLSQIVTKIDGRAKSVEWKVLDFSEGEAKKSLIYQFSVALTSRCEGLILKPNAAFFSLMGNHTGGWCKGFIKLKKDYMTDMGGARDVADFAVVAASYDVHEAQKSRFQNVRWTNFYLGCLVDNDDCYQQKPTFKIVAIVKASHCIPPKELEFLNQIGQFHGKNFDIDESLEQFTVIIGKNPQPTFVFTDPLVVEVLGSNFEKPHNENFYMLRHPRILRIHMDRSWEDCITMQGLADMAREAKEAPLEGGSQEVRDQVSRFMEKINRARDQDRSSLVSRQTTPRSGTAPSKFLCDKHSVYEDAKPSNRSHPGQKNNGPQFGCGRLHEGSVTVVSAIYTVDRDHCDSNSIS